MTHRSAQFSLFRRAFVSKVAAAATFAVTACSVFEPPPAGSADGGAGTSGGGGTSGGSGTGGTETGPWWAYTTAQQCESAGLPTAEDRPAGEDPGEELPPIYLAVTRYRLSAEDTPAMATSTTAWRDIGFDLDKLCTSSQTCKPNGQALVQHACEPVVGIPGDGNQCRDNTVGKLFYLASTSENVGKLFGMTEADWNCEFRRGGYSAIFKISNYNGKKNDRQVRVDLYTSTGLKTPLGFSCREGGIAGSLDPDWHTRALWTSSMHWKVMEHSLAFNEQPVNNEIPGSKFYDALAYVRNGYLFAKLPNGTEWWMNGKHTDIPGFRLIVQRPFVVGELSQDPNNQDFWKLDNAIISGVVTPDHMLQGFREIGYCEQMCSSYGLNRNYLNDSRDALADDRIGPGNACEGATCVKCDGLTWAGDIEARQATALAEDIEPLTAAAPPTDCPEPRHPAAPRQDTPCGSAGAGGTGGTGGNGDGGS
ncbi:MAG TPA: hypothetical protein VK524_06800 [Polyangiaceae bacterium]|nr:hypothetical protein [Polyangiaceae bacterium]